MASRRVLQCRVQIEEDEHGVAKNRSSILDSFLQRRPPPASIMESGSEAKARKDRIVSDDSTSVEGQGRQAAFAPSPKKENEKEKACYSGCCGYSGYDACNAC